jgi:DNA-binding NarL/FixJ family response regulator
MKNPTAVLADDETGIREMTAIILRMEKVDVIGEARDGAEAMKLCRRLKPNFLLTDMRLPVADAMCVQHRLREEKLPIPVMIYTGCEDDRMLAEALAAKPAVVVHKADPWADFQRGVRSAVEGSTFFSPRLTRVHGLPKALTERQPLTDAETVLLKLIASSRMNKEAAEILGITEKAVENRRASLMQKLDLHDAPALTRFAVRHGLVEA